jgi:hypothetical protein
VTHSGCWLRVNATAKGFGMANIEHSAPVTTQTVFQTASLAKQFTAVASLHLSLQDWLTWQSALRKRAVLRPASGDSVFTPAHLNSGKAYTYGLGWERHHGSEPGWLQGW